MEQLLSVRALLGNVEDVDVVLCQSHLLHAVGWPCLVQLGQQEAHGRKERVRLRIGGEGGREGGKWHCDWVVYTHAVQLDTDY